MTQIHLTLETEFLKDLFMADIGRTLYERSDNDQIYRNGYRQRDFTVRIGTLNLHIPKLRKGHFSTQLFSRYQRNKRAFMLSLMKMVIQGVSTRKVSKITETLCGTMFSAQTVSNLCKELDTEINEFRNRPLTHDYPFIIADATYVRVHSKNYGVISVGLFIVLGIRENGVREVLAFDVYEKETKDTWKLMFKTLKERGLQGVQLITTDAHCGIQDAVKQEFPGCAWQRCQTHFSRNVLDACPANLMTNIKEQLRDMYEAPTLEECKKRKDQIVKKYSEYAPRAMKVLDNG